MRAKFLFLSIISILSLLGLTIAVDTVAPPVKYTPTSDYTLTRIMGWPVYVNKELSTQHQQLLKDGKALLKKQFVQIIKAVPKELLPELRKVPVWMEYQIVPHGAMCYHPSEKWLRANGYNPEKAKSVEISDVKNFIEWSKHQPWMVMHEMAHAYHHRVIGHDYEPINQAYKKALESKLYESVMYYNGKKKRAYAMNNSKEYFAEAFFGKNDFYPFINSELKEHDPELFALLTKVWSFTKKSVQASPALLKPQS